MAVRIVLQGVGLYVFLEGEIDHHSAAVVRNAIDRALLREHPRELIMDFAGVTFMDSSGVGLVMGRYRNAQGIGCKVSIANLRERELKVMKMSGLEKKVEIKEAVR